MIVKGMYRDKAKEELKRLRLEAEEALKAEKIRRKGIIDEYIAHGVVEESFTLTGASVYRPLVLSTLTVLGFEYHSRRNRFTKYIFYG